MGNTEKKILGGLGLLALVATGAGAAGIGPLAGMMGAGGVASGAGAEALGTKIAAGALTSMATQGAMSAMQPTVSQTQPIGSALPPPPQMDLSPLMNQPSRLATLQQLGLV